MLYRLVQQHSASFIAHTEASTSAELPRFKLKAPWRDGTTHPVMSPLEFMQRLAAKATEGRPSGIVPWPRLHPIRFQGVLAPNAKLRSLVVPQGPLEQERLAAEATAAA